MLQRLFIPCLLLVSFACNSQSSSADGPFFRYTDFHIHPTYKHYFRPGTAAQMKRILASVRFDRTADTIWFDPAYKQEIESINWTKYKKQKIRALRNGITSDLRNYDQAGYPEIMFLPGSILCNSYSPYEKQFALQLGKRIISSLIVTKMGLRRLNAYSKRSHSPFRDFLAEYYYNLMQTEEKLVKLIVPETLYGKKGISSEKTRLVYNRIKLVRNSEELRQVLEENDKVFASLLTANDTPHIVTPMVMSIEGAQVLYDTLSGDAKNIMKPLCSECPNKEAVHCELLKRVDSLKNLHHRLFFITLAHFAQNHVVGFAKTLDRDPENFQHRAISALTVIPSLRNNVLHKTYAGFNETDSIGFQVLKAFLNPHDNRFNKPTYIDVKHMDIKARIQYYYMRRRYEKEFKVNIPIIASHFGVSGETQAMAAATGLWPNFDRYGENEDPRKFYNKFILKNEDADDRKQWWKDVMQAKFFPNPEDSLNGFERRMYRPMDFANNDTAWEPPFEPFEKYDLKKDISVGWFYPWSINLFDEEIIEIDKSDGIIGLLMDPRQLGSFMPQYKRPEYVQFVKDSFNGIKQKLVDSDLVDLGLRKEDIDLIEYRICEPLIRNIFYIVQVIKRQQAAETFYADSAKHDAAATKIKFPGFVIDADLKVTKKDPWRLIAIGSDYDGLIDPIDISPTASYLPFLYKRLVVYAWMFSAIHASEFFDPVSGEKLITSLRDSKLKMDQFFYENGRDFIKKYF